MRRDATRQTNVQVSDDDTYMFPRDAHFVVSRSSPHALAVSSAPSASAAFPALIRELMDFEHFQAGSFGEAPPQRALAAAAAAQSAAVVQADAKELSLGVLRLLERQALPLLRAQGGVRGAASRPRRPPPACLRRSRRRAQPLTLAQDGALSPREPPPYDAFRLRLTTAPHASQCSRVATPSSHALAQRTSAHRGRAPVLR